MNDMCDLDGLLNALEGEHLEFKEAKHQFHSERLIEYCVALANEGGGRLILGVTDKPPRRVVGTAAFSDLARKKAELTEQLRLRIEAFEGMHQDGRVVVFEIPSRPLGMPLKYKGRYLMRSGESLVSMTEDQLKRIFAESGPDFSSEICTSADISDLDSAAVDAFRQVWYRKSRQETLLHIPSEQLLEDAELTFNNGITYAALILLGTKKALGRHLSQSEVIYEYRSDEISGPAQRRVEYRLGFFLFYDSLWNEIRVRNDVQHFRDGLFIWDIPTFNEAVVREAVLNAVSHRDYRLGGSVFVRQFPRRLEIESPGGLPTGITPENILFKQNPRNRRIAEVLAKCGLVERSGQGVNLMFEQCIKESKAVPDYNQSDAYEVKLRLEGQIQDPKFLEFLEKVGQETLAAFTTSDLLVLHLVHKEAPIPDSLKPHIRRLLDVGVIEQVGSGRGTRYILSRQLYAFLGRKGTHTRKRGLNKETNKELLIAHLKEEQQHGSPLNELMQVLPDLSYRQVRLLLAELLAEERVHHVGITRAGKWYYGPLKKDDNV